MNGKIVPSKLNRVRVFQAHTVYRHEGQSKVLDVSRSTKTVEQQIHDWVDKTGAYIVTTGPLTLTTDKCLLDESPDSPIITTEMRVLPVIFVPAVEQPDDNVYGQQDSTTLGSFSVAHEPEDQGSSRKISDGPRARTKRIRLFIPADQVKREDPGGD